VIKKIMKIGNSGKTYQILACPSTIVEKLSVPLNISRHTRVAPSETS
jgi:hypothetical protein